MKKVSKKEIIGLATCLIVLPFVISIPIVAIRVRKLLKKEEEAR